jgi:formylglycine-generating enzyme required for sulfatase activity
VNLSDHLADQLPEKPYPGLRPFEITEWAIFFGRERMIDEVIELLGRRRVVVVHGSSGSGKSSLIRAGVLPRLARQHLRHGVPWRTCTMRPSGGPLWNLAVALAGLEDSLDIERIDAIRCEFDRRGVDLDWVVAGLAVPAGDHICILIDQFEEIFRYARESNPDEPELLVKLLNGVLAEEHEGARVHIVITMRSEFLGYCARFPGLAEAVNRAQYLLPRMDRDGLLRAIRRPAELYGGLVTEGLAERLITDGGRERDELPLIQHGLMRLWEKAGGGPSVRLDLEHYETEHGLTRMLSDHAEAVLRSVASDTQSERAVVAERLFRALIDINPEGQAIRRPQRFQDLVTVTAAAPDLLRAILDAFRAEGVSFITPYAPAPIGDDTVLDISHEAMIRCWTRIADKTSGWLQREFQDGLTWKGLLARAAEGGLLTPATIEDRERWMKTVTPGWTSRYGGGRDAVERLIRESRRARNRAQFVQGSALLAMGILLTIALLQWRAAQEQAMRALAQKLAAQASLYQDTQPKLALALAAEGANKVPTPETTGALLSVLQRHPLVPPRVSETSDLRSVLGVGNRSAGGARIDEHERVVDQSGSPFLDSSGVEVTGHALAATPDNGTLAVGHSDGAITLHDVATREQLGGPLLGHSAPVTALAFVSDRTLVSKDERGTLFRWPVGLEEWTKRACRLAGSEGQGQLVKHLGGVSSRLACEGLSVAELPEPASNPGDMVAVKRGWFWMGCNPDVDDECFAGEIGRYVYLEAFAIDRTEVTVAAYRLCVDAGVCSKPESRSDPSDRDRFYCTWGLSGYEYNPINCVTWFQAEQYCEWRGKRLPREQEWERAARWVDGRKYPWGQEGFSGATLWANIADESAKQSLPPGFAITEGYNDGVSATARVGSFRAGDSKEGAQDMSGNVWEWVWDETTGGRGMRGGSWGDRPQHVRASNRASKDPKSWDAYRGFRCAL